MSNEVLTNDEVDALLDGVESGEVEVQSADGPHYASVAPFEIPQRSRIVSRSFPKLELLNDRFAEQLKKRTGQLLQSELGVSCGETASSSFGEICAQHPDGQVAVEFVAPPLVGRGAIVLGAELVHHLVELFFGGGASEPGEPRIGGFTVGELRVIRTYSTVVLDVLKTLWEPIQEINPELHKTELNVSLLDIAEEPDQVIKSTFNFLVDEHDGALYLLLPAAMVERILPMFKGTERKEDPAQDERWANTIREVLAEINVTLSSDVGHARMTLGELICLEPGDVIGIDSPRTARINAHSVPLLEGRFGVHGGRNAVEASKWLGADTEKTVKDGTYG